MKKILQLAIILLNAWSWMGAPAQVAPEATGPRALPVIANLQYSARYSQAAFLYGANGGDQVSSIASADLTYAHPSVRHPFNLNYGGGYMWSIAGPSLGAGIFQHLLVSQGLVQRRWEVQVGDNVSYTPEAPITGFSGVPGTGEAIGTSGTSPSSGQSILTVNTRTLSNDASVVLGYNLTYRTVLNVGGDWQLLRFPDGNGLDSNGQTAYTGVTRRLDSRNSMSGRYTYSHYSYGASPYGDGAPGSFDTQALTAGYQRAWSRRVTTNVLIGPQWATGSDSALVPSSRTLMVKATVDYDFNTEAASLSYTRGISGTSGYLPGATVETVSAGFSRLFERNLTLGATGSYERTSALAGTAGATTAKFGGAQASERLGPYFSAFGSYTAIDQSANLVPQANILNQFYQVISFGIAYAPREAKRR